ncbi:MAG: lysylphosphatidylglycerol synthase transmembrane domain-containing protein [Methanotrichaceae archaeon]
MSWKWLARLIIGLLIIAALLYKFNLDEVILTIRSARPMYLVLGVLVYSITFLILSLRWKMILTWMENDLPLTQAYQAFVGGVLLSDLTPARIGDLSRPLMVRDRININRGITSVVIDRYADILTIFLLGFSGLLLLSRFFGAYLIFAFFAFLIILLPASLIWLKRPFMIRQIDRLGWTKLTELARAFDEAIETIEDVPGLMMKSVLLTLIAWATHALRVVLIAKSVGYDVPLHVLFFLQPLVSALSLIPITISGLGLVEGGLTALLAGLGVPLAAGISIAILDRAITVAFHILVGGRYATRIL